MLLAKDSILYNLPLELDEKQLLIIDTLRVTCELIDYNYEVLLNAIDTVSKKHSEKYDKPKQINILTNSIWSIIDHIQRLVKIYKLLPSDNNYQFHKDIVYISKIRNTYQHLNDRIKECLFEKNMPFYGIISWETDSDEKNQMIKFFVFIGLITNHKQIDVKATKSDVFVNKYERVSIETYINNATIKNPIFIRKEFLIKSLIDDTRKVMENLDKILLKTIKENKATPVDWAKRRDVIFKIKI